MIGWALVGAGAAAIGRPLRNRWALAAYGIVCGFLFDWLMDVWAWSTLGPSADLHSFMALAATGIPFDVAHAGGNAVIAAGRGPDPDPHARPLRAAPAWQPSHPWRQT